MTKRTYTGPIIERDIEWGIVKSNNFMHSAPDYHLAVDNVTGDLMLIVGMYTADVDGLVRLAAYGVSSFMPLNDSRTAWGDTKFHVTSTETMPLQGISLNNTGELNMADTMSTVMLKGLATKELKQMAKEIAVELQRRAAAEVGNG